MNRTALEISQDLIKIPSYSGYNSQVIDYIADLLQEYGFQCQKIDFEGNGSYKVNNLHAIFNPNNSKQNIYFAGHTDIVHEGDAEKWSVDPFAATIDNDKLIGRGASDMKCALACFLSAATQFVNQNPNPDFAIGFIITNDEESEGINGTKKLLQWMEQNNLNIDNCIVGEPTNPSKLGEMIKVGRRGSVNFNLEVTGKQGHVAYNEIALNPITALTDILHTLKIHTFDHGNEYFPATNLEVTSVASDDFGENVIPFKANANFNVRFNSNHKSQDIIELVSYVVEKNTTGLNYKYELKNRVSGESFLSAVSDFATKCQKIIQQRTGEIAEFGTTGGTSDARFITNYCKNMIEFGLVNATAHKIDEFALVDEIQSLQEIYLEIINSFK